MKRVLHINVTAGTGSTGRVAEGIARAAAAAGYENRMLFGRGANGSRFPAIRLGKRYDFLRNVARTRISDEHGMSLRSQTRKTLEEIEREFKPDIVHLHNIHGYWINVPELFDWLKKVNARVVWTLHDCWPLTGHCAHFLPFDCDRWKTGCHDCPASRSYPASLLRDASEKNYLLKKELFHRVGGRLTVVAVSRWLDETVAESFLKDVTHTFIHNGIDTSVFKPMSEPVEKIKKKYGINPEEDVILCAASKWTPEKGARFLPLLAKALPENFRLTVVGKTGRELRDELRRSGAMIAGDAASADKMSEFYNMACCFVNPTLADSLPTVNLEAQGCGTPVASFDAGGCRETVAGNCGAVVAVGDVDKLAEAATRMRERGGIVSEQCRTFIETFFDSDRQFRKYVELYDRLT